MANEPTLFPVKPGTLNAKDKTALRKAGVIVIEHEDPESLRLLKPCSKIDGDELLLAALRGIRAYEEKCHSPAKVMTLELAKMLDAKANAQGERQP